MHKNAHDHDKAVCKKQLQFGGGRTERLSDDECNELLKQWLLEGLRIPRDDPAARELHSAYDPRLFDKGASHEALDARLDAELPLDLRA